MISSPSRVSIICPFHNEGRFLEEAIASVLDQDYHDWRLLLIDDGSSDGSTAIAKNAAQRHPDRIAYLATPGHRNVGASAARNLALAEAGGEFIAFIDGDDVWRPGKLSEQLAILEANPGVGMVCGAVNYWHSWNGGTDRIVVAGHVRDRPSQRERTILAVYPLGSRQSASMDAMVRKAIIDAVGGFDDSFRGLYGDQVFFAKIYLTAPVYFSSAVWLDYRQHDSSCVSTAHRTGKYAAARRKFLGWLAEHTSSLADAERAALAKAIARAHWDLDHPLVARIGRRLRLR